MYWGKLDQPHEDFIRLPHRLAVDDRLYIFSQYLYIEPRIEAFRTANMHHEIPPGLALIGTPGIGELVPIHLLI